MHLKHNSLECKILSGATALKKKGGDNPVKNSNTILALMDGKFLWNMKCCYNFHIFFEIVNWVFQTFIESAIALQECILNTFIYEMFAKIYI